MMFNFEVNQHLFFALASSDSRPLIKAIKDTKPRPATAQWGHFLRNHDELDLGRLNKKQPRNRLRGIRSRRGHATVSAWDSTPSRSHAAGGSPRRLELAYSLMMTLPGTPVIRYGDEIGMGDNLTLPERNCARTPMQWSTEPQAGFTKSDHPLLPVISQGPYGFQHVK